MYKIVDGDITKIEEYLKNEYYAQHVVIPHVCNDIGAWGAGVSGAIGKRWPLAESKYKNKYTYRLGEIIRVDIDEIGSLNYYHIVNMIAQHKLPCVANSRPCIRYGALVECMNSVKEYILREIYYHSIHAPMFGAGLAGGNWDVIEQIIHEVWVDNGIDVTIYRYK